MVNLTDQFVLIAALFLFCQVFEFCIFLWPFPGALAWSESLIRLAAPLLTTILMVSFNQDNLFANVVLPFIIAAVPAILSRLKLFVLDKRRSKRIELRHQKEQVH